MYGYQVPHDYAEAVELDQQNSNTQWQDAISLEMNQLDDYQLLIDCSKSELRKIPDRY